MGMQQQLTARDAEAVLTGRPLVACLSGTLLYVKEARDRCLAVGIPALAAAPTPGRG